MRYAQEKGNHSYKLELHDLKAFIAFLPFSGYVDLPIRPMFWECSGDVHNEATSSMMSRNRFDEIMKYLHLPDNTSFDPHVKFSKVRPLLDTVNKQCFSNYPPEQTISINESMVPYFGRHGCKQLMKNQACKYLDTNFGLLQLHSDMPFNFILIWVKTTFLIQIWGLESL